MHECQCIHVVFHNPSLVVRTRHEGLGLFLRGNIEAIVVNSLEEALDHCILTTLCFKGTFEKLEVLHTHFLTIDYHVARNNLCSVAYYTLLIHKTVHLRSQSNELSNTMSTVFDLQNGSRQLLVEFKERFQ